MEWFRKTSPAIVDTQLGALSLDFVLVRKDYPYMFVVENENHNYYAFWETEHTAYYEQWYCTSIPFWLRNTIKKYDNYISLVWDISKRGRNFEDSIEDVEFFYLRHWFEDDGVSIEITEDKAPGEIYDSRWDY